MVLDMGNPRNESKTHYLLKCLGYIILRGLNCIIIAPEKSVVPSFSVQGNGRKIVDLLGYQKDYQGDDEWIVRAIECKASYTDFKSGFVTDGADYIYVMSPKDVIPTREIPPKIGHIEIDFDAIIEQGLEAEEAIAQCDAQTDISPSAFYLKYRDYSFDWFSFSKMPQRISMTNVQRRIKERPYFENIAQRNTTELKNIVKRSMVKTLLGDKE